MPPSVWWWNGEHKRVGVRQECPYGQPSDKLWVRETFSATHTSEEHTRKHGRIEYRAYCDAFAEEMLSLRWTPSIHMPRWASRITLEIVSVRVERLLDITEDDAKAEGVEPWVIGAGWREYGLAPEEEIAGTFPLESAVASFSSLWESINGEGSWEQNPWVWVVEFKRIEQSGTA